jgi:hypothetical protein
VVGFSGLQRPTAYRAGPTAPAGLHGGRPLSR